MLSTGLKRHCHSLIWLLWKRKLLAPWQNTSSFQFACGADISTRPIFPPSKALDRDDGSPDLQSQNRSLVFAWCCLKLPTHTVETSEFMTTTIVIKCKQKRTLQMDVSFICQLMSKCKMSQCWDFKVMIHRSYTWQKHGCYEKQGQGKLNQH